MNPHCGGFEATALAPQSQRDLLRSRHTWAANGGGRATSLANLRSFWEIAASVNLDMRR